MMTIDAAVWLRFGELDEVVTVAGHQQTIVVVGKSQNGGIGGLRREDVTEAQDFVIEFPEQVGEILGYVLIEQESHGSCAI